MLAVRCSSTRGPRPGSGGLDMLAVRCSYTRGPRPGSRGLDMLAVRCSYTRGPRPGSGGLDMLVVQLHQRTETRKWRSGHVSGALQLHQRTQTRKWSLSPALPTIRSLKAPPSTNLRVGVETGETPPPTAQHSGRGSRWLSEVDPAQSGKIWFNSKDP
ncbi:unnamed protein product [Merluccius merluccius]